MMGLSKFERLARSVAYAGGDKLVFVQPDGRLRCCPADGERASALLNCTPPRYQIVGVFSPGVTAARLAEEIE